MNQDASEILEPFRKYPSSSIVRAGHYDVMLDPWIELPAPRPIACVRGTYGPLPLPDPPEIPADEDVS